MLFRSLFKSKLARRQRARQEGCGLTCTSPVALAARFVPGHPRSRSSQQLHTPYDVHAQLLAHATAVDWSSAYELLLV